MAKQRSTSLPPDIGKLAEGEEEYVDRRATPQPPKVQYVEDDPILAMGDPHAILSEQAPAPSLDEVSDAMAEAATAPAIELATNADPIARLAAAMEAIAQRQAGPLGGDTRLMERLVAVMERVASGQQASANATADAIRKSQDPSNMFAPNVSVFNPRGERDHPRPQLKCKMFLPWEAEVESLTREEIELLNLLESGEYYIRRNDESRILITIGVSTNPNSGKADRLLMNSETGFNNDYHWLIPPLRSMLRQILAQRPATKVAAAAVRTMEDELALIELHGVDFEKLQQEEVA